MKIYKDKNNKVHEIEEGFEHLLPIGSVEITQAEADILLAPTAEELEEKRKQENAVAVLIEIQKLFPSIRSMGDMEFMIDVSEAMNIVNPSDNYNAAKQLHEDFINAD